MQQYEYKVIAKPDAAFINSKGLDKLAEQTQEQLLELGQEGWRLIQWQGGLMVLIRAK